MGAGSVVVRAWGFLWAVLSASSRGVSMSSGGGGGGKGLE